MKRYNIFLAFVLIFLVSCAQDELDLGGNGISSKNGFQIIGAAEDFDVKTVGTRADGDEVADSYISEMTMFIFKADGSLVQGYSDSGLTTACSSAINIQKGNPTFLVDTEDGILASLDGSNQTLIYYNNQATDLGQCKIYIVANAWHQLQPELNNITTIAALEAFTLDIDATLGMPKKDDTHYRGFPMIGTHLDAVKFNLEKGGSNSHSVATIPLKKLYSKVRFTMQVNATQVVSGQIPKFQIKNVEVFNVPTKVRMGRALDANGKPEYGADAADDYITEIADGSITDANKADYYRFTGNGVDPFVITEFKDNRTTIEHTLSATPSDNYLIEFGFYMPEHKVTPSTITYPDGITDDLKQYYKPQCVGVVRKGDGTITAAKIATFVRIHGTYTDHNGQIKDVKYDIYLGQNNSTDFTVKRNQLLNNKLVIKGLTNFHDAYPDVQGNISIDHRVDVDYKGFNLSVEREAILDSHFEVRPLDVELSPGSTMTITIPEEYRSWLAMEDDAKARAATDRTPYIRDKGVRKYFTTDLVSELNRPVDNGGNGGKIKIVHDVTQEKSKIFRIWFYIDENPNVYDKLLGADGGITSSPSDGYTVYGEGEKMYRNCPVEFRYEGIDNENIGGGAATVSKTVKVNFQQWNLWRVWNTQRTRYYDIEHEEEYLNIYASDQNYGETQDGMEWGLDGIQLSHTQQAAYVREDNGGILSWVLNTFSNGFTEWVNDMITNSGISPYYDFYLTRDNPYSSITPRDYQGLFLNKEIATTLKASSDPKAKIDGVILTEKPTSAFSYCYNKNKRNGEGRVENQNWYLPAIDEIEEIAMGAYDEFDKVFQSKEYWSCQPAFTRNKISVNISLAWIITGSTDGDYYEDDIDRARSTKIVYNETTQKYENISSSVDGSTNLLKIKNKSTFDSELVYSEPISAGETITYHEGNNSRIGEKCRIRAVYRSGVK